MVRANAGGSSRRWSGSGPRGPELPPEPARRGVPAAAGGGAGPGLSSGAAPWGGLAGAEAAPYEEPVGQLPLAAGLHHPNTALARCPETLRDYVALHELVHFVHPDHGPGFYGLMDRLMPDWRQRRKELRRYGGALVG